MAFNKANFLEKVLAVQTIYREYSAKGSTGIWIYENLIKDNFFISKRTFDNYLTIPASRELKKLKTAAA